MKWPWQRTASPIPPIEVGQRIELRRATQGIESLVQVVREIRDELRRREATRVVQFQVIEKNGNKVMYVLKSDGKLWGRGKGADDDQWSDWWEVEMPT